MKNILNSRYQVIQSYRSGGFGRTLLALDLQMPSKRMCIIKQFKPRQDDIDRETLRIMQERFKREAAVLERLSESHSQIPKLYAYFVEDDDFYIVQEFIEGNTVELAVRENGKMKEEEVRKFLLSTLQVLEYIHAEGIIHRDIKPANIILRKQDGEPVLVDFGAVKEIVATIIDTYGTPASSSIAIGTPGYVPLEQAIGKPVFASDLYSIGMTAIYLLIGQAPQRFIDPSTGELQWQQSAPNISPELIAVLIKATHTDYKHRYATAHEMHSALLKIGNQEQKTQTTKTQLIAQKQYPNRTPTVPIKSPAALGRRRTNLSIRNYHYLMDKVLGGINLFVLIIVLLSGCCLGFYFSTYLLQLFYMPLILPDGNINYYDKDLKDQLAFLFLFLSTIGGALLTAKPATYLHDNLYPHYEMKLFISHIPTIIGLPAGFFVGMYWFKPWYWALSTAIGIICGSLVGILINRFSN